MDIKREPVIDAQGRHRGYKLWIICPNCEQGRWVREDSARKPHFTGFCNKCHAQFTTGQFEEHSNWKGGRLIKGDGYIEVKLQPSDPFYPMARKSGYVREHRLVMAKHLGRLLKPSEIVHHRNGIKDDNRVDNLEIINGAVYHLLDCNTNAQIIRLRKQIKRINWNKERRSKNETRPI